MTQLLKKGMLKRDVLMLILSKLCELYERGMAENWPKKVKSKVFRARKRSYTMANVLCRGYVDPFERSPPPPPCLIFVPNEGFNQTLRQV